MTNFYKWLLFISSYAPLYLLLAVNNFNFNITPIKYLSQLSCNAQHLVFWIVITALFLISIISVSYFKFISLNERRMISKLKPINEGVLTYIIPYLIPLLEMNINSLNSLLVNALLFIIIGIVYVKSDLLYINILLIILGFSVYVDSNENIIITNYKLDELIVSENNGESLLCRKVVKGIYLIRRH